MNESMIEPTNKAMLLHDLTILSQFVHSFVSLSVSLATRIDNVVALRIVLALDAKAMIKYPLSTIFSYLRVFVNTDILRDDVVITGYLFVKMILFYEFGFLLILNLSN